MKIESLPPSGIVSIENIARDFASDPIAAKNKYEHKRIKVLGVISNIENGSADVPLIVTLLDPAKNDVSMKAEFLLGSLPMHSDLEVSSNGASAALLNRIQGKKKHMGETRMERSVFLKKNQQLAVEGCYENINAGVVVLSDCAILQGKENEIVNSIREELAQRKLFTPQETPTPAQAGQQPSPATNQPANVIATIPANSPNGYSLGAVRKGTKITFQYVSGMWKSWGHKATVNPDEEKLAGGQLCRLVIALPGTENAIGKVVSTIPAGTQHTPFIFEAGQDYPGLLLRINSPTFKGPGKVVYLLKVEVPK